MAIKNRQVLLAARPLGFPKLTDFQIVERDAGSPADGEFLVEIEYLSLDPYMRGRMNAARSYADPVAIGDVMTGGAVGRVVESKHAAFREGDWVEGMFGWQEYAVSNGAGVRKLDPAAAPVSTALGILGMPGLTAYFGVTTILKPKPGETLLVSGAAGAVGSYAGQIGKILGCRVAGIAGSDEKVDWVVNELGFDAAFNYKTSEYLAKLKELCPRGIDCYFDNVGGPITDAAFTLMNPRGRVAVCGQISLYNLEKPDAGPRLLPIVLVRQLKVEGFLVFQFAGRYEEGLAQMGEWLKQGKLKYRETVAHGIENAPAAFLGMLRGENIGKQLVRLR